jgi:hypothetical protein
MMGVDWLTPAVLQPPVGGLEIQTESFRGYIFVGYNCEPEYLVLKFVGLGAGDPQEMLTAEGLVDIMKVYSIFSRGAQ